MNPIIRTVVVSLAVAVLCGCGALPALGGAGRTPTGDLPVIVCSIEASVPDRWRLVRAIEIDGRDRVGVRALYRSRADRTLHLTSGVEGEMGEALPVRARPLLVGGSHASLHGMPGGKLWVLAWSPGDRCGWRTATGIGLGRAAFLRVMTRAGVVMPP